jgi:MFS family permease
LALIPTTGGFLGLLMVSLIAGIGNGLGSGIVMTLGADLSPRNSTGEFLGIWHLMGDIGAASGPLLIGAVAQVLGLFAAPIVVALFGLLGAWVMVFRVDETLAKKPTDT